MMMMMMMIVSTHLIIWTRYSEVDIILQELVSCGEDPDISSLAVLSVEDDVGDVLVPGAGHLVPHTVPQDTGH